MLSARWREEGWREGEREGERERLAGGAIQREGGVKIAMC